MSMNRHDLPSPQERVITEAQIGSTSQKPLEAAETVLSSNATALAAIALTAVLASKKKKG